VAGVFVISDFELMWGIRDRRSVASYGDAILGGRKAIPQILRLFEQYGVKATWATVGLLFARNRSEMQDYSPPLKPAYNDPNLSPYEVIDRQIGNDERSDPLHFGRSLVELIRNTEGQELATHTFSHYYCLECGQSLETFVADLRSAQAIAETADVKFRSIVFPRNQMTMEHIHAASSLGITCFRGTPKASGYSPRAVRDTTTLVRLFRFADSILPIDGLHGYKLVPADAAPFNIPASRFLRPPLVRLRLPSDLFLNRIKSEMASAARRGHLYHLWCHPHNFGREIEFCLERLSHLLDYFRHLSDRYGMQCRSMADLAESKMTVDNSTWGRAL
jgi:peptidoglycan/xylan/chitin deacetylase (PgdA/CDA1 family)